jgi:hypothetical protein
VWAAARDDAPMPASLADAIGDRFHFRMLVDMQ